MSRRFRILVAFSIVAVVGGVIWSVLRPQELVYESKSLTVWLEGYDADAGTEQRKNADEAVRSIGTKAIPTLVRLLQKEDSSKVYDVSQAQKTLKYTFSRGPAKIPNSQCPNGCCLPLFNPSTQTDFSVDSSG